MQADSAAPEPHGLVVLRELLRRSKYLAPICRPLNFWASEIGVGHAVFEGQPKAEHSNALGMIHGGYAATMLDSALGTAVHTTLEAWERYATCDLVVKLVRRITVESGPLRCEAIVAHRGRRLATADARLWDASGELCAHGSASCLIHGERVDRSGPRSIR